MQQQQQQGQPRPFEPRQRSFRQPMNRPVSNNSATATGNRSQGGVVEPPRTKPTRIFREPRRYRDADKELQVYLFEVHEMADAKLFGGDKYWANIRDINKQSSVEIPFSMAKELLTHLISCKLDPADPVKAEEPEEQEEHDQEQDENEERIEPDYESKFDLSKLQNIKWSSADKLFTVSIADSTLYCEPLSSGPEEEETTGAAGDLKVEQEDRRDLLKPRSKKGSIILSDWLVPRMILFMRDALIRHLDLEENYTSIRSLYAPSGERRFYFDLMSTSWGNRLQISQVTSQHRNVISLPLENLIQFRDRLDVLIDRLSLDQGYNLRLGGARKFQPKQPKKVIANSRFRGGGLGRKSANAGNSSKRPNNMGPRRRRTRNVNNDVKTNNGTTAVAEATNTSTAATVAQDQDPRPVTQN